MICRDEGHSHIWLWSWRAAFGLKSSHGEKETSVVVVTEPMTPRTPQGNPSWINEKETSGDYLVVRDWKKDLWKWRVLFFFSFLKTIQDMQDYFLARGNNSLSAWSS